MRPSAAAGGRRPDTRRREPDADDLQLRIDRLQRVVARRQITAEGGRGGVGPRLPELRAPERGLVRLVADHELAHLRVRARDGGDVGAKGRGRPQTRLYLAWRIWIDREHDAQPRAERA